jgi:hypothetical protein
VTSADAARAADTINLRFADGRLNVHPAEEGAEDERET